MPSFKSTTIAALALAIPSAMATSVLFRAGSQCTDEITFGSTDLNKKVNCYDVTSFGDLPSVNVVNTTAGHQVNFYADDACKDLLVTAKDDGCVPAAGQSTFGSWSITSDQSAGSNDAATTSLDLKMTNYTGMGLTDPEHIDLSLSIPFIAAATLGTAGVGLTFFASYKACQAAAESVAVSDIIACVGGPLATAFAATAGYFASQVGNAVNARLDLALNTFTDVKRADLDSVLHDYVSSITGGSHVGYMVHQGHNLTGPIYDMEVVPGQKYHVAAFVNPQTGALTHHLHTAQETELHKRKAGLDKRDSPYPYNDIKWDAGGLDWNICAYDVDTSLWNSDPTSYFNSFYDQLNCIFGGRQEAYTAYGQIIADFHDTNMNIAGEVEIVPYTGTYAGQNAPACQPKNIVAVNGNCLIN